MGLSMGSEERWDLHATRREAPANATVADSAQAFNDFGAVIGRVVLFRAMRMTRAQALALLRLEEGATEADVNKTFRRIALKHHPDKIGGDGNKFREYACARDTLVGRQEARPHVSAAEADEHRYVIYRVQGATTWDALHIHIGVVEWTP